MKRGRSNEQKQVLNCCVIFACRQKKEQQRQPTYDKDNDDAQVFRQRAKQANNVTPVVNAAIVWQAAVAHHRTGTRLWSPGGRAVHRRSALRRHAGQAPQRCATARRSEASRFIVSCVCVRSSFAESGLFRMSGQVRRCPTSRPRISLTLPATDARRSSAAKSTWHHVRDELLVSFRLRFFVDAHLYLGLSRECLICRRWSPRTRTRWSVCWLSCVAAKCAKSRPTS